MIAIISAVAKDGCIGKNGKLPWDLPEDLKRFRDLTAGKVVIMGQRTWESLPEKFRPLPNRTNVVITQEQNYPVPEGVRIFSNLPDATAAFTDQQIMMIGGARIYAEAINFADELFITHIDQTVENGDVFFPTIDPAIWIETENEPHPGFTFSHYIRR
ncbi:MAG: dihydrofolate reductase [Candidatus Uhrbacteria bacterium]